MLYHASAFNPPSSPAYCVCWRPGKKTFPLDASIPTAAQQNTPERGCYRCWRPPSGTSKSCAGPLTQGNQGYPSTAPFFSAQWDNSPNSTARASMENRRIYPSHNPAKSERFNEIMRSSDNTVLVWTSISWMIQTSSAPSPCVLGVLRHTKLLCTEKRQKGGCLSVTSWAPVEAGRFTSTALHSNIYDSVRKSCLGLTITVWSQNKLNQKKTISLQNKNLCRRKLNQHSSVHKFPHAGKYWSHICSSKPLYSRLHLFSHLPC